MRDWKHTNNRHMAHKQRVSEQAYIRPCIVCYASLACSFHRLPRNGWEDRDWLRRGQSHKANPFSRYSAEQHSNKVNAQHTCTHRTGCGMSLRVYNFYRTEICGALLPGCMVACVTVLVWRSECVWMKTVYGIVENYWLVFRRVACIWDFLNKIDFYRGVDKFWT